MKWIISLLVATLTVGTMFAQVPEQFSYQSIIRDSNNELLSDSDVTMRFLFRKGSENGSIVYEEIHTIRTNDNGLVSIQLGTGTAIAGKFSNIAWQEGPFFIESQVDIKGGSNFSISGVSQLLSVPYALHAKSAEMFTGTITSAQISDLNFSGGTNDTDFSGWDKDVTDDFSGNFYDLQDLPTIYTADEIDNLLLNINSSKDNSNKLSLRGNILYLDNSNSVRFANWDMNVKDDFSGNYEDLQNKPELYNKVDIDNLLSSIEVDGAVPQNLDLDNNTLSISGGNAISFENWDTNAGDDFSGNYEDLQNKPEIFSGNYADLLNKPELYTKVDIDNLLSSIEVDGAVPQNLDLDNNILSISGGNAISFENWDTNAGDDFSGNYEDLQNKPELYTKVDIDNLLSSIEVDGAVPQNLDLDNNTLSISGGNAISFENWDTNVGDDFSGNYEDLQNKPELYTKVDIDNLLSSIEVDGAVPQNLDLDNNILSISGGNAISFENWDTNAGDDFSGNYEDLQNKPELYTKVDIDNLLSSIEVDGAVPQNLDLHNNTLSISGGNAISFENWDTNAGDDFSGNYEDLQNKPEIFSGNYPDLLNKPELYTKVDIDNLLSSIEVDGAVPQNLDLDNNTLSISGGNAISFENWDTNAGDDFSGNYEDLQNKPDIFSGNYADLNGLPAIYNKSEIDNFFNEINNQTNSAQILDLNGTTLSITRGNSIKFEEWDTNASDDFDGAYTSLTGAPKVYTQDEVDEIKESILQEIEQKYVLKRNVVNLGSSRNINSNDVGSTIACINSATLTLTSNFSTMQVGDVINAEVHGTTFTIKAASGVVINGKSGGSANIGNDEVYTGGIIRKTASNSYIVL